MEFEIRKEHPTDIKYIYHIIHNTLNVATLKFEIRDNTVFIVHISGIENSGIRAAFRREYILRPSLILLFEMIKDFGHPLFGIRISFYRLETPGKKLIDGLIKNHSDEFNLKNSFITLSVDRIDKIRKIFNNSKLKSIARPKPIERPSMKINLLRKRI